jgi:glycerol-3-phosphate acyltransferase PlsY
MNYLFAVIIGYLLGSFSSAYSFGKVTRKIDIRHFGSGNAGATNVIRVLGKRAAAIVFILDISKGVAAVLLGRWLGGQTGAMLAGSGAVIGHNWPLFLNFRGGKGIATTIGILAMLFPAELLLVFIIAALIVAYSHYVSLGSIILAILLPMTFIVFGHTFITISWGFVIGGMAVFRHRSNILRLLSGTENKITI